MEVFHPTQQLEHQGLHFPCGSNEVTHMLPLPHKLPTPLQKGPGLRVICVAQQQLDFWGWGGRFIPGTLPAQGDSELIQTGSHVLCPGGVQPYLAGRAAS